ncbi:MAG: glycosyltransferase [Acidobacteria bacterium]|nr:glycosyltransferase [Acidobacteriota bacterium]MBI3426768.1 glycosyltransferase [Acidobacteriota bacterium]
MNATSSRLKIVRIIDRLNVGGPAKHVTWLTAGLDPAEFETTLITGTVPPHEGDMTWFATAAGIEPLIIKEMSRELSPRDLLVIFKLLRVFWRLKPQIIHTHKAKAGAAGRVAAWLYKWLTPSALWLCPRPCRVVHTFHGHIFHSYYGAAKTRLFVWIERVLARLCTDCIITISQQQRREINEVFGVGRTAQFRVIPLGIDLAEAQRPKTGPTLRAQYRLAEEPLTLGIVGRLCEVKNHALLLRVLAYLQAQQPDLPERLHCFIIGDGELRASLEALTDELKLRHCVTFTGFRDDAAALYQELDLVALTSLNEGTPLTLIEALNSGRPVLATAVGGVVDILGAQLEALDGFTRWEHGLTAASGDVTALAQALRYLLNRPELRKQMGAQGQAFVRTALSRERLLRDIAVLYREMAP